MACESNRRIVLETDLGRDPDDFFTICLLLASGVDIAAVTLSPGDSDQVALAKCLLRQCGQTSIPVGVGIMDREKSSVGGAQASYIRKHAQADDWKHDGDGADIIRDVEGEYEVLAIGPLHSVGRFLQRGGKLNQVTMQGGFVPYSAHTQDVVRLEKFEGKLEVPTFNLGGNKQGAHRLLNPDMVGKRRFVGKNVCHTVLYDIPIHERVMRWDAGGLASLAFRELMGVFVEERGEGFMKAFHDPLAACLMLDPTIGVWMKGKPYYLNGEWGTTPDPDGDDCLIDIDRERFWLWVEEWA